MKFRVTLNNPDGVYDGLKDAASNSVRAIEGLTAGERELITESRYEAFREFAGAWFECSESITVEFDTEEETAVAVKKS